MVLRADFLKRHGARGAGPASRRVLPLALSFPGIRRKEMKGAAAAAAATAALLRPWAHESTFPLSSLLPSTDDAEFGRNTDAHPSYNIILARTDHGLGGTLAH